jgi:small multidrug resistance pump
MTWIQLFLAIFAEVIGTTALKYAEGFTRLWPSVVVILSYTIAFVLLSKVVQVLPIAVTYAIWSGVGIALVGIAGWVVLGQKLNLAGILGIGLIIAGVLILNIFSTPASGAGS